MLHGKTLAYLEDVPPGGEGCIGGREVVASVGNDIVGKGLLSLAVLLEVWMTGRQTMMAWGDPHRQLLQHRPFPMASINGIVGMTSQYKNIGDQVMTRHPVNPGNEGREMAAGHAPAVCHLGVPGRSQPPHIAGTSFAQVGNCPGSCGGDYLKEP